MQLWVQTSGWLAVSRFLPSHLEKPAKARFGARGLQVMWLACNTYIELGPGPERVWSINATPKPK